MRGVTIRKFNTPSAIWQFLLTRLMRGVTERIGIDGEQYEISLLTRLMRGVTSAPIKM